MRRAGLRVHWLDALVGVLAMSDPVCPRCAGLVAELYDDPHCLNCGWRRCEPVQLNQIERASNGPGLRRGRRSTMTLEERTERNRAYMREYWRRRKAGVKKRAYVKRRKVTE